tara:strand:+ start:17676 stop:18965 length:1290 start_codon:yes stop_codon:yes gene_type:complete
MIVFIFLDCSEPNKELKDTIAPEVYILNPITGAVISELTSITAYASDNIGIKKVEFLINDTISYLADTVDTVYIIEWNSSHYSNDEYTLQAVATDFSDNSSLSLPISFIVDNSNSSPKAQNIKNIIYNRTKMTITWEPSVETDFQAYQILISESYNGQKSSIVTIMDSSRTSYTTSEFNPGIVHYYWLKVIDDYNYTSIGHGYRLVDAAPTPVDLDFNDLGNGIYRIFWTMNTDSDFVSYTLNMLQYDNMNNDSILFVSNNNQDTSFTPAFVLTERFYQITIQDYWDIITRSNILEVDFGPPPAILNTNIPDTIFKSGLNEDSLYLVRAMVTDENGLESIDNVGFTSYIILDDSIRSDSAFYFLFDDGGMDTLFESGYSSGDIVEGDGLYCNQILINNQFGVGVYDWVFKAQDINQQLSHPFEIRVVIE